MRNYYPVFMDIEGRKCVVVGGGEVAARKTRSLSDAGAEVRVVSPVFCPELVRLANKGGVKLVPKSFQARDLNGAFLTIACTSDRKVNGRVCRAAQRRGVLVNVVDSPSQCDFIVPSVVSRGALTIAISTSGVSPALARNMRRELEKRYGPRYGDFLALMEENRERIIRAVTSIRERRKIFEALTDKKVVAKFLNLDRRSGKRFFEQKLKQLLPGLDIGHV